MHIYPHILNKKFSALPKTTSYCFLIYKLRQNFEKCSNFVRGDESTAKAEKLPIVPPKDPPPWRVDPPKNISVS